MMVTMVTVLQVVLSVPALLLLALWVRYQWRHRRQLAIARSIPTCVPTLPILGHLYYLAGTFKSNSAMGEDFLSTVSSGTTCAWIGPVPVIVLHRPEDIKKLLNSSKTLDKARVYELFKFLFGNGLLTAPGYLWKKTRRHINPLFSPRNLEHYIDKFNETSARLVERLGEHVGRGHVDVMRDVAQHSVINIYRLLNGAEIHLDSHSEYISDTIYLLERAGIAMVNRVLYFWQWSEYVFFFLHRDIIKKMDNVWENLSKPLILKKKECDGKKNLTKGNNMYDNGVGQILNKEIPGPITLPEILQELQLSDPYFGEEYMRGEVQTLIGTGSDTVTVVLSSSMLALGCHPQIQETLYEEVMRVTNGSKYVTLNDIKNMVYMDQFLKEVMRRFSPIPIMGRLTSEDIRLSDCMVPVGSDVIISNVSLNMNPDIFPDPQKIDPDRFGPNSNINKGEYTYLPFSRGPRDCIGKTYAMYLLKITLAHLVREFQLSSDVDINNLKFTLAVVLVCSDGYKVELKRRK